MSLKVLRPGLFATVQDLGRSGYREYGVSTGGAFDQASLVLANALLGNSINAAGIELTLLDAEFEAIRPLAVALTGGACTLRVAGGRSIELQSPCSVGVRAGERILVGRLHRGARAYLAVSGGLMTRVTLGSRSSEVPLRSGEILEVNEGWTAVRRVPSLPESLQPADRIRYIDGPDASLLRVSIENSGAYQVQASSNRMGLRLKGGSLEVRADPLRLSMPVAPGTIQVAGGQPIILGVNCGTMGGYPHVGQVIAADVDRLGQLRPGQCVRFERIGVEEARAINRRRRADLRECSVRLASLATDLGRMWMPDD